MGSLSIPGIFTLYQSKLLISFVILSAHTYIIVTFEVEMVHAK